MKQAFKIIKKYGIITVACILYGMGVALFIDPNNMAPGGFTGLAIILNRLIPLNTGFLYLLLNVPVILLGIYKFGWKFTVSTLYAILVISVTTDILAKLPPLTDDRLLAGVFGGGLIGCGIGLIMLRNATTGGMDIVIRCLRLRFRHLKMGSLTLALDAMVIGLSGLIFRNFNSVFYSMISVGVTSIVLDRVLYGRDEAKLIYIISDRAEEIAEKLMSDLDVGVTYLKGSGAYHNKDKQVIMCVVKMQLAPMVEEVVKKEDDSSFMIVTRATEIFGEGYKSYFRDFI